ncbi:hypothetical protein E2L07_20195 [Halalkalibacterium halodurans]|uniref:hypothetical protein n=1 Tax=Halalkalibacterium halodurans TaxID=86665 RepID=UPI001067DA3D|nr:hypothetical protein [Halalkalibacterium halodurans]TES45806.1 hypothetical protein E2L07_20195 [Halalkalibacterium halodurans]
MDISGIPSKEDCPEYEEVLLQLLESIVKKEMVLSQLIIEKTSQIDELIKKQHTLSPEYYHSLKRLSESILMQEWLLYTKINKIMTLQGEDVKWIRNP